VGEQGNDPEQKKATNTHVRINGIFHIAASTPPQGARKSSIKGLDVSGSAKTSPLK
jgi:hypothetical protein